MDYLDVKKFYYDNPKEKKELEEFVALAENLKGKDFILDLRDNSGGTDQYIWDFIEGLLDETPSITYKYIQKYSNTFLEFLKRENMDEEHTAGSLEIEEEDGEKIVSRNKIYVLINENTASSGESAIAYFKNIDNAVIVGEHSRGCYSFGNCMTIYLPHSKIPVYFGTGMLLLDKTRNIDAEGGFKGDISYEEFLKLVKI